MRSKLLTLLVRFGPIGGILYTFTLLNECLISLKSSLFIYYLLVLKTDFEVAMILLDSICNTIYKRFQRHSLELKTFQTNKIEILLTLKKSSNNK